MIQVFSSAAVWNSFSLIFDLSTDKFQTKSLENI